MERVELMRLAAIRNASVAYCVPNAQVQQDVLTGWKWAYRSSRALQSNQTLSDLEMTRKRRKLSEMQRRRRRLHSRDEERMLSGFMLRLRQATNDTGLLEFVRDHKTLLIDSLIDVRQTQKKRTPPKQTLQTANITSTRIHGRSFYNIFTATARLAESRLTNGVERICKNLYFEAHDGCVAHAYRNCKWTNDYINTTGCDNNRWKCITGYEWNAFNSRCEALPMTGGMYRLSESYMRYLCAYTAHNRDELCTLYRISDFEFSRKIEMNINNVGNAPFVSISRSVHATLAQERNLRNGEETITSIDSDIVEEFSETSVSVEFAINTVNPVCSVVSAGTVSLWLNFMPGNLDYGLPPDAGTRHYTLNLLNGIDGQMSVTNVMGPADAEIFFIEDGRALPLASNLITTAPDMVPARLLPISDFSSRRGAYITNVLLYRSGSNQKRDCETSNAYFEGSPVVNCFLNDLENAGLRDMTLATFAGLVGMPPGSVSWILSYGVPPSPFRSSNIVGRSRMSLFRRARNNIIAGWRGATFALALTDFAFATGGHENDFTRLYADLFGTGDGIGVRQASSIVDKIVSVHD
ncbi:MAG: hypothetical protein VX178_00355, partial [Pseudomonadota bacterium]|nr:hypothetical protein [Pseudomonadota bacterium]